MFVHAGLRGGKCSERLLSEGGPGEKGKWNSALFVPLCVPVVLLLRRKDPGLSKEEEEEEE